MAAFFYLYSLESITEPELSLKPCKYIYISCFFILWVSQARGQDNIGEDAYEPDSVFAVVNAVKIDPIQIVFGDFRLFYERLLTNQYSVEVGVGITGRNYAADVFDYSLDDLGDNIDIDPGYNFSIAVRHYFRESEEMIGPYISLGFDTRKYNTTYSVIDSSGALTGDTFKDVRRLSTLYATFGFQAIPLSSNIFGDFYIGAGVRSVDFDIVRADDVRRPETYFISNTNEYRPAILVGVKLGFGF